MAVDSVGDSVLVGVAGPFVGVVMTGGPSAKADCMLLTRLEVAESGSKASTGKVLLRGRPERRCKYRRPSAFCSDSEGLSRPAIKELFAPLGWAYVPIMYGECMLEVKRRSESQLEVRALKAKQRYNKEK